MKNKIEEYRKKLGLSQCELAEKSGVSRVVINQLENGKRPIVKSDTMVKLSDALGEEIGTLFLL